jgi:hypothetical protein
MAIVTFQYPPAAPTTLPLGASTSALQTAGNASLASIDSKLASPMPVSGPLTDTQLRATAVPVSGSFYQATQPVSIASSVPVTGPLTDIELRATAVPVSLASNPLPTGASTSALQTAGNASLASIDSKLTNPLPVSGTFYQATQPVSIASSVAVTGPLTDTQLRATAVPVSLASTTVTGSVAVTGPLTDTQLRASAVPVSGNITTVSTVTTVGTVNAISSVSNLVNVVNTLEYSAAVITTTTTKSASTVNSGNVIAFSLNITAASGTNPTYDFKVQESHDGATFYDVYHAPRFTTTGTLETPHIRLAGNRYRIVETISGTTPSFTRTVASDLSIQSVGLRRSIIDRTINPATTNSTSPVITALSATNVQLIVNQGSGGSAVVFAIDGSNDNSNWVQNLATVSGVVGGATPVSAFASGSYNFYRARVVLGVASATISNLELIATDSPVDLSVVAKVSANAPVYNDYTSTSVTSAAYVQLVAATTQNATEIEIFDSSGYPLYLAFGAAASEVNKVIIIPGGNGRIPLAVPAGTRISVKSVSTSNTSGFISINFYA